jgi:small GTP-binding protein
MIQKKICMLGTNSVGKTSLVSQFVHTHFSDKYVSNIGVMLEKKTLRANNTDVELLLWDLYGEDKFQKVMTSQLRGMSGYFLVVDGTRLHTLDDALALNERISLTTSKVPSLLLLNKADLADQWEIPKDRQEQLAAQGWEILLTSAKTGLNVEEAFQRLALKMLAK